MIFPFTIRKKIPYPVSWIRYPIRAAKQKDLPFLEGPFCFVSAKWLSAHQSTIVFPLLRQAMTRSRHMLMYDSCLAVLRLILPI